jgi:hypothetical protein
MFCPMRLSALAATLLLVAPAHVLPAQTFFSPGQEIDGKISVQVNATLNDGIGDYHPIAGLALTLYRNATDSLVLRTDDAGVLQFSVQPGTYRLAANTPVQWHGRSYRWNQALEVRKGMPLFNLTVENASIAPTASDERFADRDDAPKAQATSAQAGATAPAVRTVPRAQMTVYLGGGTKEPGMDMPALSAGFLYFNNTLPWALGVDAAMEGALRDATYGSVSTEQGYSFNALGGGSLRVGDGRIGVAGLIGARATGRSCPSSYLGYQCYADADPTVNYKLNLGGVVHVSFKRFLVGFRHTEQSDQVIAGGVF